MANGLAMSVTRRTGPKNPRRAKLSERISHVCYERNRTEEPTKGKGWIPMVPGKLKLDDKDKKLLSLLSEDPDMSQDALAAEIELSQPSVAMRLKKLRKKGILRTLSGIDPFRLGLSLAKVDVTTSNTTKILDRLKECPHFLIGYIVSGKFNLCMFFIGEELATLEAIVDCHLRQIGDIRNVEFNIIIGATEDLTVPLKMRLEKTDEPPCGVTVGCTDCPVYGNRCLGCPATARYLGSFW